MCVCVCVCVTKELKALENRDAHQQPQQLKVGYSLQGKRKTHDLM